MNRQEPPSDRIEADGDPRHLDRPPRPWWIHQFWRTSLQTGQGSWGALRKLPAIMTLKLKPGLNWLLVFVPITLLLEYVWHTRAAVVFMCSCLAIIPLGGVMGHATEGLAARAGAGVGGLLNATFGNAAEMIIAFINLKTFDVVRPP